ncbi:MAG TPA: hypothetical protein VMB81_29845 [Candidatus Sulfotelmatobacter sp.]|nr:hypothetical protein [Candidatus Sulfotelmatobacter sp.]
MGVIDRTSQRRMTDHDGMRTAGRTRRLANRGANPSLREAREADTVIGIEVAYRAHQAELAFGGQVVPGQAAVAILPGGIDDEVSVAPGQAMGGRDVVAVAPPVSERLLGVGAQRRDGSIVRRRAVVRGCGGPVRFHALGSFSAGPSRVATTPVA